MSTESEASAQDVAQISPIKEENIWRRWKNVTDHRPLDQIALRWAPRWAARSIPTRCRTPDGL